MRMSLTQVFVFHYVCVATFEVTVHVGDVGHRSPSVYQFEVRRPSRSEIWLIFGHGIKSPGDFDL